MNEQQYLEISEREIRKIYRKIGCKPSVADGVIRRRHAHVLDERTRSLRRFEAYQTCPKCDVQAFHLMKEGIRRKRVITRKCNDCGYEWSQE